MIDFREQEGPDYALPRGEFDVAKAVGSVAPICEAVRMEGEAAIPDDVVRLAEGATVTIRAVPVSRVGLYAPGGLAPSRPA